MTNKVVSELEGRGVGVGVSPHEEAHWDHALVNDGSTVIVAGGEDKASIEVFHILVHCGSTTAFSTQHHRHRHTL